MTIPAKVSALEVTNVLTNRYVDQQFQARLINLPAYSYDPGVAGSDVTLLNGEVLQGTAGYKRATLSFASSDVGVYADGGVPLAQKATTFAHDGGGTALTFSHVALTWSTGAAATLGAVTANPATAANGTYTNVPVSTPDRGGLKVDITVSSGTFTVAIATGHAGFGYTGGDTVTINNRKLLSLDSGLTSSDDLTFTIASVDSNGAATALGSVTTSPTGASDGSYTNTSITTPLDRANLTVDVTVTAGPAFAVAINNPGYGYSATDAVEITATDLNALDPTIVTSDPDLEFTVATVSSNLPAGTEAGDLFTAVKTSSTVNLTGGSEAAFYWNLKQFGFYG